MELSAIPSRRVDNVPNVELAQLRVRVEVQGEPQSFEFWVGESPSDDSVTNQRTWLERTLTVRFPQALNEALTDLVKVNKEEGISCADLAAQA